MFIPKLIAELRRLQAETSTGNLSPYFEFRQFASANALTLADAYDEQKKRADELEEINENLVEDLRRLRVKYESAETEGWRLLQEKLEAKSRIAALEAELGRAVQSMTRLLHLFEASAQYHQDCRLCVSHVEIAKTELAALTGEK